MFLSHSENRRVEVYVKNIEYLAKYIRTAVDNKMTWKQHSEDKKANRFNPVMRPPRPMTQTPLKFLAVNPGFAFILLLKCNSL